MKSLQTIFVIMASLALPSYGKAYFQSQSELIANASVIAIIELQDPQPAKTLKDQRKNIDPSSDVDPFAEGAAGKEWLYSTQANATIVKQLKGDIPKEFILYGGESFICAQCTLAKGRYLAFLRKDGNCWAGSNWQSSLRPIREDQVEWFVSEEERHPMKFQNLEKVISQIQASIEQTKSEQAAPSNR
jgi:hypothetical protein